MSLCEGRECGDEQLKTWGRAQAAAGHSASQCAQCAPHMLCCDSTTDETVSNTEEGDTAPTVARTGLGADC